MTVLEPAAQAFADATAKPPFLFQLEPADGRKAVDEVQTTDYPKLAIDEEWVTVRTATARQGADRAPAGSTGRAAGDPLHPRRRLGVRQRAHA